MQEKVVIVIGSIYSKIKSDLPERIDHQLDRALSYESQGHEHTVAYKEDRWDGIIRLYDPGRHFRTGLMSIVRDVLKSFGYEIIYDDRRNKPEQNFPELEFTLPEGFEERPYQQFTVNSSIKFTRGIMRVATGGGKTLMATNIIGELKVKPFLYFVLTKDLMYQAYDTMKMCLNQDIGIIGDGICDIKDINICSVQTVVRCIHANDIDFNAKDYKYDSEDIWDDDKIFDDTKSESVVRLLRQCKGFYFDEVHHAAAKTCIDVIQAAENAYYKFGGSATPERDDGEDLVVQSMFGARIVDISASYLIKNNYLVPASMFVTTLKSNSGGNVSYRKIYNEVIVDAEDFNNEIVEIVKFLERNDILCLLLVQFKKHGKYLHKMLPGSEFLTGNDTSKRRNEVINRMRDRKLKILIATTLADEGLDIKPVQAVFMLGAGASVTRVPQRIGRCLRTYVNKKYGMFFYFRHTVKYLFEQGRKVVQIMEKEPEFEIKKIRGIDKLKEEVCRYINEKENENGLLEDEL